MSKTPIFSEAAPKPMPVYSQGIIATGETIFCSGQVGLDPNTGTYAIGGFKERVIQCIKNLESVLKSAGSTLDDVVKVNAFLGNMDDFEEFNEIYINFFGDIKPARTCIQAGRLPGNTDVEIECVAIKGA